MLIYCIVEKNKYVMEKMKNINKILLLLLVLFFSLSVYGKSRFRKIVRQDACEKYYQRATRANDMKTRLNYLKQAMTHAKTKDQEIKILIEEAYTLNKLGSKELAMMTIDDALSKRFSTRLKNQLLVAKIVLSKKQDIKDEKLVLIAEKLIFQREFQDNYYLYSYIANHYMIKKQYQKAFDAYKRLERRSKRNSSIYHIALIKQVYIAGCYLARIQDVKILVRKMERSKASSDRLGEFYYYVGIAFRVANDTKQAMKYFNKGILTRSQTYTCLAYIEKGKLFKTMKKPVEALKNLASAQRLASRSTHYYGIGIAAAEIHIESKNYDEAMSVLKKALKNIDNKKYPFHEAALLLKTANVNFDLGKKNLAAGQYKKIAKNLSFPARIRNMASRQYYLRSNNKIVTKLKNIDELIRSRDYEAALTVAKSAAAKLKSGSPFYYSAILKQIYILTRMRKNSEALSLLESVRVSSLPKNSRRLYYSYKVQCHAALEQPEETIAAYREYIQYDKRAELLLANYLKKTKHPKEALEIYEKIFNDKNTKSDQKAIAIYNSVELLSEIGKHKEALALMKKLYKIPECSKFHVASAKLLSAGILMSQGKLSKARRACYYAKRGFEAVINSKESSSTDIRKSLDKWTECDISLMEKSSHTYKTKEGSFILETNLPNNEKLKITYMVPVDSDGEPLPSAHNVVFYAPYAGDNAPLKKDTAKYFAKKLGFTVFSFNMDLDLSFANDKQKFYIYNESGWHDIVFEAQQKLTKDFKLSPNKLLVVGQSSGGSMAHQLATSHPDKIDAVAMIGGGSYSLVDKNSTVAWLTLNTWGDVFVLAAKKFKKQAQSAGIQVLCGETPFSLKKKSDRYAHHEAGPFAWKLMQAFIRDVAALREKNNGIMPIAENWPQTETINNEKLFLPSEEFASLWKKIPHEGTAILANKEDDSYITVMPPSGHARAVVLFVHDPSFYDSTNLMDNLYFLAKQKNIAVAVKVSDNHFETLEKIQNTLETVLENEKWKNLRVYVLGSGDGGRLAAIAALSNNNPRISKITTFNSEYRWPFIELSPIKYRRKSRIPLTMLADNEDSIIKTKSRRTKPVLIKSNGTKFGKWWFYLLDQATKK